MTVSDIIKSAQALMGYGSVDVIGYNDEAMLQRSILAVNHIIADLDGKITVKEANEQLPLPISALRAMPYGVAMLLSLAEGDAARNNTFANIYNAMRAAAKGSISTVVDTIPTSEVGI